MTRTRRRTFPWWLLLVSFVAVPLLEIFVIVQVGQVIGAWWTILLLVADSVVGAWLVKREGSRAWGALSTALQERRMPARELADGVLILVGGTLMLTPGFVTDALGILFILPLTRPVARRALASLITRKLTGVGFPGPGGASRTGPFPPGSGPGTGFPSGFGTGSRPDPAAGASGRDPGTRQRPGDPDDGVVRGEVVDEGPEPPR